jgi:hypothetical protein
MFGLDKSGHFFKAPAPRTMPLGDKMAGGSGAGDSISEVTFPEAPSSEELFLAASAPDVSLCRVAPSAVISWSRLKGPLVIGGNCCMTRYNAIIFLPLSPLVIGENCRIVRQREPSPCRKIAV